MSTPYLIKHPPRQTQYRARRAKVTGCIVVHTAESAPDVTGPDTGTENVARFIQGRADYGSYHTLADSDSRLQLVPYHLCTYGDGTGSNEFAIHISAATQAHRWPTLSQAWREGAVKQMAASAADAAKWLAKEHGITVPARRITKLQSNQGKAGFISHGERDPGRRSDPGAAFPWDLFLTEYKRLMAPEPPPKPEPETRVLKMMHVSLQFSDNDEQMAYDVDKIFKRASRRGVAWITGTEAGGEKAKPLPELLQAAADKYGYRLHRAKGEWIAVDRDLIKGGWQEGYVPVLKAGASRTGNHTDRGVAWVSFDTEELGRISVGTAHYLTKGRPVANKEYSANLDLNVQLAKAIGDWARLKGQGKDLAFYSGDQNIVDREHDTFLGQADLTSLWDELDKYQNTGHGNIDVWATLDSDGRVEAVGIQALDDDRVFLNTDHYLVEGRVRVRVL